MVFNDQVTVFVVEDDDVDFMTIKRSFAKSRITNPLVRATNGQQALTMLQNKAVAYPFVILLDLKLPKLSGLELLSSIRADAGLADAVVFILTTSSDERDIIRSYQHNVAGYFVKEQAGSHFLDICQVLNGYWQTVHFAAQG